VLFALPQTALAHSDNTESVTTLLHPDPWLLIPLMVTLLLYVLGLRRLWRGATGRGVSTLQVGAFTAGWLLLLMTLLGPLDRWAGNSLAAHVAQHMLLMAAVPPLLLLGRPGVVMLGLLPTPSARALSTPLQRARRLRLWRLLASPGTAMLVQTAVMWGWHLPAAMDLTLRDDAVHWLMHASFLAVGLWFWGALLRGIRDPGAGAGSGAVAIIGSMMAMGLLGALLTFADAPRYPTYMARARHAGVSALEDQQLAGLIMWVPSALPYLIGGLVIAALWLRRSERQL
jgi:putative membrane protein